MAERRQDFEGQADGTTLTTGNTGSGTSDALSTVNLGAGSTGTFENDAAHHGSRGARLTGASGQPAQIGYTMPAADAELMNAASITATTPSAEDAWLTIRNWSGTTDVQVAHIGINTGLALNLNRASGTFHATLVNPVIANAKYYLELKGIIAGSPTTSNGTLQANVYLEDNETALSNYSDSAVNIGILPLYIGRAGKTTSSANTNVRDIDDFRVGTGADAISKRPAFTAPHANYGGPRCGAWGGTQNTTSAATTVIDLPTGSAIPLGDAVVLVIGCDNSGTNGAAPGITSVTDSKSNTWTVLGPALADPGAANAGACFYLAYIAQLGTAYDDGDDITINWAGGSNPAAKATYVFTWADGFDASTPVAVSAQTASGSSTTPSVGITPTAAGQIVLGFVAAAASPADTYTADGDSTDGSWGQLPSRSTHHTTAASNIRVRGAVKVVTGTSAQTFNPGLGTSRDWAAFAVVFNQNVPLEKVPLTATRTSSTSAEIDIPTIPGDATDGMTIIRAPGTHVNDGDGNPPDHVDYDPFTIAGAVIVAEGLDSGDVPYSDAGLAP